MIVIRILLLLVFLFVSAVNAVVLSATSGFDFDGAIKNVQSMLNIIYHRYELNTPRGFNMWYTLENLSTDIWDTFKYKFARKLIDKSNVDFLMVFGGSSVTAGHDSR